MLTVIGLITLSSFGLKEEKRENVLRTRYIVSCSGVYTGSFVCEYGCNWHSIAMDMCGY